MKKPTALTSGLVAVKGAAAPVVDMPTRTAIVEKSSSDSESNLQPLNFKVTASLRRDFKTYAASHDLKLNELLKLSFEAYRKQKGD